MSLQGGGSLKRREVQLSGVSDSASLGLADDEGEERGRLTLSSQLEGPHRCF